MAEVASKPLDSMADRPAVETLAVVEDFDVFEDGGPAAGMVVRVWRWTSSVLRVAKKVSATASSQHGMSGRETDTAA